MKTGWSQGRDVSEEKEFCGKCEKEQMHWVDHREMSNGNPYRKGQCSVCKMGPRALPINTKPADAHCFYFGKHKHVPFKEVPHEYLQWALENVDLNFSTRQRVMETLAHGV